MNKFKQTKHTARQYPEWLRKLQRHLATAPTAPGKIHRLDFAHQVDCAKWRGGTCDCDPRVEVDGVTVNGKH